MKTLPKFLIFKGGIPDIEIFSTDKNIEVLNLLDIIENTPNIKEIYTQIKNFEERLIAIKNSLTYLQPIETKINEYERLEKEKKKFLGHHTTTQQCYPEYRVDPS